MMPLVQPSLLQQHVQHGHQQLFGATVEQLFGAVSHLE
jgi:hypothetical protein